MESDRKTSVRVAVCESSSGHLTQTGESPGCWLAERKANGRRRREAEEGRHGTAGTPAKLQLRRLFAQDDTVKSTGHSWGTLAR